MRIVRRLVHTVLIVLTLIVGATAAGVIATQTAWLRNWLRGYIVREAGQYLNGSLSIDRVGGNLFFGLELENIVVSMDGRPVIAVKDAGLDYSVFEIVSKGLSVNSIRLNQPVLYLRRDGDAWSVSRLIKREAFEADRSGPGRPVSLDAIDISDGSVVFDQRVGTSGVNVPKRIDRLDARLALKYEPVRYTLDVSQVSFRGSDPEIVVNALSGGVSVREDTLFVDKLAVRTAETSLSIDGAVQHYLSTPVFNVAVSSDRLSLPELSRLVPAVSGINLQPAFEVKVNGPADHLGVAMNVRASVGEAAATLLVSGRRVDVQGRVAAYGVTATAAGRVVLPKDKEATTYDLRGRASGLNLRRLPRELKGPRAETDINAAYHVQSSRAQHMNVDLTLDASSVAGASIAKGSQVALSLAGKRVGYQVDATVARLDLQKIGEQFRVPAIAGARYKSVIDGHVTASGQATTDVRLAASDATAAVELQPSTIGGLKIDRASLDADFHNSVGDVRALDIVGHDVNVSAHGTVALDENGQSTLTVHADSSNLEQIGTLLNQPVTGIGMVDATVTGNRHDLQVAGTFTGDGVTYGGNGALTMMTQFVAKVPELSPAGTTFTADTHATFVTVAGQNINDVTARTGYANKELMFDATATQPQRSAAATGSLLMHPDRQEIRLQRLAVTTQGMTWQTPSDSAPVINYAHDAVSIVGLALVNGDQRIDAAGAYGRPGDALTVTMNNVDVGAVDTLLLRAPTLAGRASGAATIRSASDISAQFEITKGAFKTFHYDSFGGAVRYSGRGLTLDTKLQQNPTQWFTAKGYVPIEAASNPGARANGQHEAASAEDRFDVHVHSSPIDLGVVQGFTAALTNVTGTVQADVDITGAADDPQPLGEVTLRNGAFKVGPTGIVYTGLDGRIDLQPDRIHVGELRVLDNQKKALTISGDLGIHELQAGQVNVALKADDFKVLDNDMGSIRVNSDLHIAGELRAPRVEGQLGVTSGTLNLDPILAAAGSSAYATRQTEYLPKTVSSAGDAVAPGIFDMLRTDVHVTVPDDLVVKATDLKTPGAPLGLGAINITLGGDLRLTKVAYDTVRPIGVVTAIRGFYDFQGRRFDILRDGTVRFEGDGLDELDPVLDVRAQRVIQGVTADVNVRGLLQYPEVTLTSTPPLEQADILALIIFNQPINQLGEAQQISLAQRAASFATGALTSELSRSIGDALNLNQFEINLAPELGNTAQVTLGQQVAQNLYVKVQQGIGDESQTNFVLEYDLTKWLRLQTNVLQGSTTQQQLFERAQDSGADLLFFLSF